MNRAIGSDDQIDTRQEITVGTNTVGNVRAAHLLLAFQQHNHIAGQAPRNRQPRFGPQVSPVAVLDDPEEIKQGLHPDVVGRLVIEAVRADRLYIFTDPRFRRLVEKRFQRLLDDYSFTEAQAQLEQALQRLAAL